MSISSLRKERAEKEKERNIYRKRKNSIYPIINNIDNRFDDDVKDINVQIIDCFYELAQGLKGCDATDSISTNMESCKQKISGSDSYLSSARSNLSAEINRCQEEIDRLDSEIRSINNEIRNLEEEMRRQEEEERRQKEEARRQEEELRNRNKAI